jgi:XTP/dITP diphosphohydrolase
MPEVIESGKSLSENAWLKAKQISNFSTLPTLADDSGLFIDALDGQPGIYSSRWAGYEGNDSRQKDQLNISKALSELANIPVGKRGAQFKTMVAFYKPNSDGSFIEHEQLGVFKAARYHKGQLVSLALVMTQFLSRMVSRKPWHSLHLG